MVNFFGRMSQGGHSEQLLFFALFYQSTPSCLKVMGGKGWGGGGGGPCDFSVSPRSKSFFFFWRGGTFIRLGGLFGQGLGLGLGPGLDKCSQYGIFRESKLRSVSMGLFRQAD